MKALIVTANILLLAALAAVAAPLFSGDKTSKKNESVRAARGAAAAKNKAKGKKAAARKNVPAEEPSAPATREEQKTAISEADIFNSERTPNAVFGRRNARVELALVGTIEAGKYRAAVIIQRTNSRQINPFMRMMWGPGGANGAQFGGRGGGRGVRRFGMGMGMQQNNQRRNDMNAVKQYIRVGETMPNGYKLTVLTRTRATLTRGGDKMELELQAPSKNQNASRRGGGQRLNVNQQLQQAQLQTQQMMVRALMEMRGSGGGGRGGNRGGGNRGGRR